MKFVEIQGNMLIGVSNEEMLLVERVRSSMDPVTKQSLTDREQEVARGLVIRGVFDRIKIDEKIAFVYNELDDVWKD